MFHHKDYQLWHEVFRPTLVTDTRAEYIFRNGIDSAQSHAAVKFRWAGHSVSQDSQHDTVSGSPSVRIGLVRERDRGSGLNHISQTRNDPTLVQIGNLGVDRQ